MKIKVISSEYPVKEREVLEKMGCFYEKDPGYYEAGKKLYFSTIQTREYGGEKRAYKINYRISRKPDGSIMAAEMSFNVLEKAYKDKSLVVWRDDMTGTGWETGVHMIDYAIYAMMTSLEENSGAIDEAVLKANALYMKRCFMPLNMCLLQWHLGLNIALAARASAHM